jgi:hypothetical protein
MHISKKGKNASIKVGSIIEDVIVTEQNRLLSKRGNKGRYSNKHLLDQIRVKSLQKLGLLHYYFKNAGVDPERTDPSIIKDIIQKILKCNRQTATAYANTLLYFQISGQIQHMPKIISGNPANQ